MKTNIIVLVLLITSTALATLEILFPGYDWLKENSPDIIIVRCPYTPPPPDQAITGTIKPSYIEIFTTIKGTNGFGPAVLRSDYWLRGGGIYLIFGRCENGVCSATEDFRVIPLGRESGSAWVSTASSITNAIAGKPLDEQIQILFKRASDNLNHEITKDQEEKQRLEEALKK